MEKREELMEIYKLHATLADQVSQRRLAANRLYVSLLVALMVFCGALLRIDGEAEYVGPVLCLAGVVGVLLAVSWRSVLRSHRQLNSGKFKALRELEAKLSYRFFDREWELLGEGRDRRRYRRLSMVEESVPWVFFGISLVVLGCGAWLWGSTP